jgi:hypothetical protein
MMRVTVVVLADVASHADLGRLANALSLAKDAQAAGDQVEIVFDGAGTRWIPELARGDHKLHRTFEGLRPVIAGACEFCSGAFGVRDQVVESGVTLLSEFEGHPSLRARLALGAAVVTF